MKRPSNTAQVATATAAQDELEQLIRTGVTAGAAALSPLRAGVQRALRKAESFEELRHHLVELVRDTDADALTKQLMRARLMARMTGILTVRTETQTGEG